MGGTFRFLITVCRMAELRKEIHKTLAIGSGDDMQTESRFGQRLARNFFKVMRREGRTIFGDVTLRRTSSCHGTRESRGSTRSNKASDHRDRSIRRARDVSRDVRFIEEQYRRFTAGFGSPARAFWVKTSPCDPRGNAHYPPS